MYESIESEENIMIFNSRFEKKKSYSLFEIKSIT